MKPIVSNARSASAWFAFAAVLAAGVRAGESAALAPRPVPPRIDSVVMALEQPQEHDAATIWYDDFDAGASEKRYAEKSGRTTARERFGGAGKALEMRYAKGSRGSGGRKLFFGDTPTYQRQAVRRGEVFTDVYWRVYLKHQRGWRGGGPAKLSRAISFSGPKWQQAMIAHVWSSGEALTLDPATGVKGDRVVTTKYNDFENLRWLGNRPPSRFRIHSAEESGRWVCVESRARLNTLGKKDGLHQLWIDGRLEAERKGLDWRGRYDGHGINAVFIEAYWNEGSPVDQSRWIDNFVVSTEPIGPIVAGSSLELIKTPYEGPGKPGTWDVEVARDSEGRSVVWRSTPVAEGEKVSVSTESGTFVGARKGSGALTADAVHFVRVRQRSEAGSASKWSGWHQPFRTAR